GAVAAGGQHPAAVLAETRKDHRALVPQHLAGLPAALHVPQAGGAVVAGGDDVLTVGAEVRLAHGPVVDPQLFQLRTLLQHRADTQPVYRLARAAALVQPQRLGEVNESAEPVAVVE